MVSFTPTPQPRTSLGAVPADQDAISPTGLTTERSCWAAGPWFRAPSSASISLTQTAKSGTSRYRASTPNDLPGLVVASWQLVGNQVQLFDEAGDIIASLILGGSQVIGTLAGGQGITMVG